MKDIGKLLSENRYPGRGIVMGLSEDGRRAMFAYFIMGRSANSRNRVFELFNGGMRTKAFDESKVTDPSLIIYAPYRRFEQKNCAAEILTNGDQTDTIFEFLGKNPDKPLDAFRTALGTRSFEPDAPNYTPRISGIGVFRYGFFYSLSIIKSGVTPDVCSRFFFDYTPKPGIGHFIHTYKCDGNPLPSFEGEPREVFIKGTPAEFAERIWSSLDEENRVSLFVRGIPLDGGEPVTVVINKNE